MISAVVAISDNNVIGDSDDLPWYLPADLKHFKNITVGHTVLMGRKTWQNIFKRLGKPLPDRENIVITRDRAFLADGATVKHDLQDTLTTAQGELFVIGGAEIYKQALPYIQRLYITRVHAVMEGDTYFPDLNYAEWKEVSTESHSADEKNPYAYTFIVLDRSNEPSTTNT